MPDLTEQLAIVTAEARCEWQSALMWACLYALGVLAVWALGRFLTRNLRRFKVKAWPFLIILVLYGGSKAQHVWSIQFSNGLSDNGSTVSGNQIIGRWTAGSVMIDGSYAVKMRYRDATITNAAGTVTDSWHAGEDAAIADLQHTWVVAGATNMQIMIWAQYVSPVVVKTNGVYKLGGVMREMGDTQKYVTPSTRCLIHTDTGEIEVITPTNRPPYVSTGTLTTLQEDNEE